MKSYCFISENDEEIPLGRVLSLLIVSILLLNSGCQHTPIPIKPSSTASLSSSMSLSNLVVTNSSPKIPTLPSCTPTFHSTPTSMVFPAPKVVPIEDFQPPMIENVETKQLNGGVWISYTPQDWPKQIQQTGEFPSISSIAMTPDSALWFATTGGEYSSGVGVYRFDGKIWTHLRIENGLPSNDILSTAVAPDGAIWFGTLCCGVSRFDGKSWTSYTIDNGLASNDVRSMAFAHDGALWIGTVDKGVSRFDGKSWQNYRFQDGENFVGGIYILPDNTLLFSTTNGTSSTLIRFDGQRWINYTTPWTDRGIYTVDIAVAPNGDIWFAPMFSGVYRFSESSWTNYTKKDGLASDEIHSVAVARDGSIWFSTANGISRFDGNKWTTLKLESDADYIWIGPILGAFDGSIWIGYIDGIAHYVPPDAM